MKRLIATLAIFHISLFSFSYADTIKVTKLPENFDVIVGEDYRKTLHFTTSGKNNDFKFEISGDRSRTGILNESYTYESEGKYHVVLYGVPKAVGKYKMSLKIIDGKKASTTQAFELNVVGLKFASSTLPDAVGLRKPYTAKLYFNNPTKSKPKFSYNFPTEFGYVNTDVENGTNYTTILFSPSKKGIFTFRADALNEVGQVIGSQNFKINITESKTALTDNPKVVNKNKTVSIKAVDWWSWLR